jgi:ubiquinone/menaquinone biosynthesis C-methylase UbiE
VVGVDPAPSLLLVARTLAADLASVSFEQADGRALPYEESTFDVVVFDSTLCHVPEPDLALAEARRVLRPGGALAIFDGDYATTTVALCDSDPLQTCADAMMRHSVHDRWLVRRLPSLVRRAGFDVVRFRGHGYVESTVGGYMLTVIDRGADLLRARGQIGEGLAAALKAEARERVAGGRFSVTSPTAA